MTKNTVVENTGGKTGVFTKEISTKTKSTIFVI